MAWKHVAIITRVKIKDGRTKAADVFLILPKNHIAIGALEFGNIVLSYRPIDEGRAVDTTPMGERVHVEST